MALDINTPRGQRTREQEKRMAELFHKRFPTLKYNDTPKTKKAIIDAVVTGRQHNVMFIVETKCREAKLNTFEGPWKSEWLITEAKLLAASEIATGMQVPLYGFLYLVPEDLLMIKMFFNPLLETPWVVEFNSKFTETQATVNGGLAWRKNAFIKMHDAVRVLR